MNRRDRIWTQEDKDDIALMRLNKVHSGVIAKKYDCPPGYISHLTALWGLPKFGSDVPRVPSDKNKSVKKPKIVDQSAPVRKCLTCRNQFYTEHRHNFVCQSCKGSALWT